MTFKEKLRALINKCQLEGGSDTPDFILADYMQDSLLAFEKATRARTRWTGYKEREQGGNGWNKAVEKIEADEQRERIARQAVIDSAA